MYQVLIKNGTVLDPGNGLCAVADVAISDGRIAEVRAGIGENATHVIDVRGCLVTPGLIDHHAHVWPLGKIGLPAEAVCFASGVTTVVDAGSCGCETYRRNRPFIEQSKLTVKAYIHVCSTGLDSLPEKMEDVNPEHFDAGAIKELFEEYRTDLSGLKLRTSAEIVGASGYEPLRQTVALGDKLGLPVMVHCTNPPGEMSELLSFLRPGDVMTHMYMNKGSTILDGGRVSRAAREARRRGVLFEAADARAHFSFEVCEPSVREGFYPDLLGTDLTKLSMYLRPTAFNMANQLAKYAFLGIPEETIFALCTCSPARQMGIADRAGSLTVGCDADVAVFRKEEQEVTFGDRPYGDPACQLRTGSFIYRPMLTVKNGEVVFRDAALF
ncbi:MAG: amidohydrolase family protein [Fretibacterium sp.]|nr:amidohydrolase family protein [Fretibacterium sp.]